MKNKLSLPPLPILSPAPATAATPCSLISPAMGVLGEREKEFFNIDYWKAFMHLDANKALKKAKIILSCLDNYCDKTKSSSLFYKITKTVSKNKNSPKLSAGNVKKFKFLDAGSGAGEVSAALHHCMSKKTDSSRLDFYCVEKSSCLSEISNDHNVECKNINADLREFLPQNKNTFDLLLSFYSSWGYGTDKENKALMKLFQKSLRSKGLIVLEIANEEWVRDNFKQTITYEGDLWSKLGLDLLKVNRHTQLKEFRQGVSYSTQHWQFIYPASPVSQPVLEGKIDKKRVKKHTNSTKTIDFTTNYCLYSAHRVKKILESSGFTDVVFLDSTLKPHKSLDKVSHLERLFIVARKRDIKK